MNMSDRLSMENYFSILKLGIWMTVWLKTHCMFIQGCPHIRYHQESNPPDEHSEWVPSLFQPRSCRVLAMAKWQLMYFAICLVWIVVIDVINPSGLAISTIADFFGHQWVWPLMDGGRDIVVVNDGWCWRMIIYRMMDDGEWWEMLVNHD